MKGRQVIRTVRTPRVCRIRHDRGVRRDQRIGLLVIVTGVFMLSLDVTMLDIVLPDFATAIGADQTQISWIADCYNVALAGLILAGDHVDTASIEGAMESGRRAAEGWLHRQREGVLAD